MGNKLDTMILETIENVLNAVEELSEEATILNRLTNSEINEEELNKALNNLIDFCKFIQVNIVKRG